MKNTPLRRKTALRPGPDYRGLARTGGPKRTKALGRGDSTLDRSGRLNARSAKTAASYAGPRRDLNATLIRGKCQIGPLLAAQGVRGTCEGRRAASCLHELRKRSSGGSIENPANVVPGCGICNGLVEAHPPEARAAGLVIREDDPRWEQLGVRWWRNHGPA